MYAGLLASVMFQKRFPDQKQGEKKKKKKKKKKKRCAINRQNDRQEYRELYYAFWRTCIGLYTFHHIYIHMQIDLKNQIFLSKLILKLSIHSTKCLKN